jgi:DsbC/DsbD-like thiol-disulfide interchange protein
MINGVTVMINRRQVVSGLAAAGSILAAPRLFAQERAAAASAWAQSSFSKVRLIAAGPIEGKPGYHHAGIEIGLAPGFKTYWRHPGDSGVPPVFNFEGSENVGAAEVMFPMPTRFTDGAGGTGFGYSEPQLLLPVVVKADDPAKPVLLKVKMDYAVCGQVCVPASGELVLDLSSKRHEAMALAIKSANDLVPDVVALGSGAPLQIAALQKGPEPEQFMVDVRVPEGLTPDLFLEGEEPWFFETKAFTRKSGELGTFLVSVIERSKAADCTGAELTLTLTADKRAIEVKTRLDLALVTH